MESFVAGSATSNNIEIELKVIYSAQFDLFFNFIATQASFDLYSEESGQYGVIKQNQDSIKN